jgi:hypothetical protein
MKMKVRVCAIAFAALVTLAVPLAKSAHPAGKLNAALSGDSRLIHHWYDGNGPMPPWQSHS